MQDLLVFKQNNILNEASNYNIFVEYSPFLAYDLSWNQYNLKHDLEHEKWEYDKAEVFEERFDRDEYGQRGEIHVAYETP